MPKATIYNQLSSLTTQYLDIGAQTFLEELIHFHLNIEPAKLNATQLIKLIDWLDIAAHLVNSDKQQVNEYMVKVRKLAGS